MDNFRVYNYDKAQKNYISDLLFTLCAGHCGYIFFALNVVHRKQLYVSPLN